jgi:hypothetical protein
MKKAYNDLYAKSLVRKTFSLSLCMESRHQLPTLPVTVSAALPETHDMACSQDNTASAHCCNRIAT